METTIKRELTINQMVKLFDIIYVKLYEPSYLLDKNREVGRNEKIFFDITIRHNPKNKPENIFTEGLKKLQLCI